MTLPHKTLRLLSLSVICLVIGLAGCSALDFKDAVSTALARTPGATAAATFSAAASAVGASSPDAAILAYLTALVGKDRQQFAGLVCPAYAKQAALEFDSFGAVKTALKGVTCKKTTTKGNVTLVACTGSISIDYNGATRSLNLSKRVYQTTQEGGTWKMCGYQP